MISTVGLSIIYFKMLSAGTYIPIIYLNYKHPFIDKLIETKLYQNYYNSFKNKYTNVSRVMHYIEFGINKSAEITIKQIQNYKNINICHKKLSKALIHTSITYKLLIPVYFYTSYMLAKKS